MSDYRNLRILGVVGLSDELSLTGDALDRARVERKMYEAQRIRGRLGAIEVNFSGQNYEFILMRAPAELSQEFSHKGKPAELFYVGLRQKKKKKRKKDENE